MQAVDLRLQADMYVACGRDEDKKDKGRKKSSETEEKKTSLLFSDLMPLFPGSLFLFRRCS